MTPRDARTPLRDEETHEPIAPYVLMAFDCVVCSGRPDVTCSGCGNRAGQPRGAKAIPLEVVDCTPEGGATALIAAIRAAGGSEWDKIGDVRAFLDRDDDTPSIPVASAEFANQVASQITEWRLLIKMFPLTNDLTGDFDPSLAATRAGAILDPSLGAADWRDTLPRLVAFAIVAAESLHKRGQAEEMKGTEVKP